MPVEDVPAHDAVAVVWSMTVLRRLARPELNGHYASVTVRERAG